VRFRRLADKDRAYAAAIEVLRGAVTDIASTPEGAAALQRFNSGDETGALAVLDRLQAADEAARQKATDVQKAVGERHIAELAFEACQRGKVDTGSVIGRYEALTRLDPDVASDWVLLGRLDLSAGRMDQAMQADEMALKQAKNDTDRMSALNEIGDVLGTREDTAAALKVRQESLVIARRLAAADPGDEHLQRGLSISLNRIGDALSTQGDFEGARRATDEGLAIARRLAAAHPASKLYARDMSRFSLLLLGDTLVQLGDLRGAAADYAEAVTFARKLLAEEPTNVTFETDLALELGRLGETNEAQGDSEAANKAFSEAVTLWRGAAATDASSEVFADSLAESLNDAGDGARLTHGFAAARRDYEEALVVERRLVAADPTNRDLECDHWLTLEKEGDTLSSLGDHAGSQLAYDEDTTIVARLAKAKSVTPGVYLTELASNTKTGVRWIDVVAQLELLQQKGLLGNGDTATLAAARQRAHQEPARGRPRS
jgi:tetratricopeptide (TPR) repeat protein